MHFKPQGLLSRMQPSSPSNALPRSMISSTAPCTHIDTHRAPAGVPHVEVWEIAAPAPIPGTLGQGLLCTERAPRIEAGGRSLVKAHQELCPTRGHQPSQRASQHNGGKRGPHRNDDATRVDGAPTRQQRASTFPQLLDRLHSTERQLRNPARGGPRVTRRGAEVLQRPSRSIAAPSAMW